VQILVVVANIQVRSLKTEVGKGSLGTVFGQGLVGPKRLGNSLSIRVLSTRCREREYG